MELPTEQVSSSAPNRSAFILPAIFLLALVLRLIILFTAECCLRSDEAVVGIMARHIVTKHEFPIFLYGQVYGGGHALVAYIAAPLFAVFGMSGTLLTAISMTFGLANIVLVMLLLRRLFAPWVACSAALLYAVAPAAVYGNFLVNGGTESIFFSLIGLTLFVSDFYGEAHRLWRPFVIGVMCGIAYWCMDFAVYYPLMYVVLWAIYRRRRLVERMLVFLSGCLVGALPVAYYDVTHNFAHLLKMTSGHASGSFLGHAAEALASMWGSDLPHLQTTNIDNFIGSAPWDAWGHYLIFMAAIVSCVVWIVRSKKADADRKPAPETMPLIFLAVFCAVYAVSHFSSPVFRTPRYFIPLYPFFAVIVASGLYRAARGRMGIGIATALVGLLAVQGIARDSQMMFTDKHQEWRITTSGKAIEELASFLESHKTYYVWTPYEIQWRLIFASKERIIASSLGLSMDRYPDYDSIFRAHAVTAHEPYAVVFDKDFKFAGLWGGLTREAWYDLLRQTKVRYKTAEVGGEFIVYYDISGNLFESSRQTEP